MIMGNLMQYQVRPLIAACCFAAMGACVFFLSGAGKGPWMLFFIASLSAMFGAFMTYAFRHDKCSPSGSSCSKIASRKVRILLAFLGIGSVFVGLGLVCSAFYLFLIGGAFMLIAIYIGGIIAIGIDLKDIWTTLQKKKGEEKKEKKWTS